MEHINLIDTFSEFKELKNIDRVTLIRVLEDAFRSVLIKLFGTDDNFDVIINTDKGDFEIWRNREPSANRVCALAKQSSTSMRDCGSKRRSSSIRPLSKR